MTDLFGDFLKQVVSDCVNGSSGSIYAKPNLEAPHAEAVCPHCGRALSFTSPDWCRACDGGEE